MGATLLNVPVGTVLDYAGSAVPSGYLECDGSAVSRTAYPALFASIGTTWGAGDGSTTFNIPDLRGRVAVGRTIYKADSGVAGANKNLLYTDRMYHNDDDYDTIRIDLNTNLSPNTTYTIQLWDVVVRHGGKDASSIGLSAYLGGGSIPLATWNGNSHYDSYDSGEHVARAHYLKATFTTPSSLANNGFINLYNSVGFANGCYRLTVGRAKIEVGSTATPWSPWDFGSSMELGEAGGTKRVIPRANQMPSHVHSVGAHHHGLNNHTHSLSNHTHGLSSHTHTTNIDHTHPAPMGGPSTSNRGKLHSSKGAYASSNGNGWAPWFGSGYNGVDSVYVPTGGGNKTSGGPSNNTSAGPSNNTSGGASGNTADSAAFNSGANGGSSSIDIMQPYAVVKKIIRAA